MRWQHGCRLRAAACARTAGGTSADASSEDSRSGPKRAAAMCFSMASGSCSSLRLKWHGRRGRLNGVKARFGRPYL